MKNLAENGEIGESVLTLQSFRVPFDVTFISNVGDVLQTKVSKYVLPEKHMGETNHLHQLQPSKVLIVSNFEGKVEEVNLFICRYSLLSWMQK